MAGIEKTIHIIPLGHEIDRAVIPFDDTTVDHVYILTGLKETNSRMDLSKKQQYYAKKVRDKLQEKGIFVTCIHINLFDLREVMKTISKIIVEEKAKNNRIFVNMSAAGRLTSVAATLVGMAHDVQVYYVHADEYPDDEEIRKIHGLSICSSQEITQLSNFKIVMPDPEDLEILLFLTKRDTARMSDILEMMHEKNIEGFEEDFKKIEQSQKKRRVQSRQLMKLDKTIIARLKKMDLFLEPKRANILMFQ
ncbi:DUF6293 family protein [Methanogenium cariaci]|uniref:HFX_2341 family transcriptional regulator domain-containing protein n=1 Tax=Methanogenium cariaci TaxID=2197 RepID=UPI001FDFED0E|nr:DUF6293 family protein [Methanogenium cariaci]